MVESSLSGVGTAWIKYLTQVLFQLLLRPLLLLLLNITSSPSLLFGALQDFYGLPELFYTHNNAAVLDGVFRGVVPGGLFAEPFVGCLNPNAMNSDDVNWYRVAMVKEGAARAMLNYYRSYLDFSVTGGGAEEVWE